ACDEDLPQHRLDFLGPFGQPGVARRNVPPAEQDLPFARDRTLDFLLAGHARRRFLGQKDHAHTVLANRRQSQTLLATHTAQMRVGKLYQDACTVALQRIGTGRSTMGEIFENLERLLDDRVTFLTFDMGDEAQTTRVMLIGWIIKTLPRRGIVLRLLHSNSPNSVYVM